MAVSTLFRRLTRRCVTVVIASAAGVGLTWGDADAQPPQTASPVSGPVPGLNLDELELEEGERIISTEVDGETFQFDGSDYDVVDPSAVPTMSAEGDHGHQLPLTGSYFGPTDCPTCGPAGHHGHPGHGGQFGHGGQLGHHRQHQGPGRDLGGRPALGLSGNVCGPICSPYRYATVDALYLDNSDGVNNRRSPARFNLSSLDFELGARITLGVVPNCRDGYEFSFVGPFRWVSQATDNSPLDSLLFPGNPVGAGDLTAFDGATQQTQRFQSELMSFEASRTIIGWDVIKLLYGIRYIQYEEDYIFQSTGGAPGTGVLRSATDNHLFGAQLGIDMIYPVTRRAWSEFRGRVGAFANFAEHSFQINNGPGIPVFNDDDRTRLAGMFELGGGLRYYVTNNFHLRAGGEIWFMTQLATAMNQFGMVITPNTAQRTRVKDDVFLYGFNLGGEWRF